MIEDLRRGALFVRLTDRQLERVAARAAWVRLRERQALFEQGDRADRFYLLLRGQIKLYRLSPGGGEKVMEVVAAGDTFAEALMFLDRARYPVTAAALRDSELIGIDAGDFAAMLRESVDTCFLLMGEMSQRLRRLIREVDELSMYSATCRVAGYLLDLARDRVEVELQVPKQVLASRLSVKPETLSRIVKQLSARGIIRVEGNRIRIEDRSALMEAADDSRTGCRMR